MEQQVECVFCDLIETGNARWVARESDAVAFLPLPDGALAPGHTLVVPRLHFVSVLDVDSQALHTTLKLVQRVSKAMCSELGATGVVLLNASGPHSGQSVNHLHFHVVPCWPDDGATFWPEDRSQHVVKGAPLELLASALSQSE